MLKKWTDDVWIFGYGTTVARYTVSTDTVTNIKTNFSVNTGFDGVRYGDYFYVCNGVDKIWYITFAGFAISQIAASPATTSVLTAIGPRLYAGYGDTVQYSETDVGGTPPFTAWNNATTATSGGKVYYRNAGTVRSILPLGENVVVFSDKGYFTFTITTFDSAGTISKTENVTNYVEDFGGARGAVSTEKGIFYANEAGMWNMVSVGQSDVPFSRQYTVISTPLGDNYFVNIDMTNCDLFYDQKKTTVYLTCADGSDTNNLIIAANVGGKSPVFYKIANWNISRFMNDDGMIYGASDGKTAIYRLFSGDTDDGAIIGTDYYQELKLGDLETKQMLKGCYIQGFLGASSTIYVRFDIYDITGKPITDKLKYEWTAQSSVSSFDGYNSAHYNGSAYGGDEDYANLIESFDGCRCFIINYGKEILYKMREIQGHYLFREAE
jgi:hypothetical protein